MRLGFYMRGLVFVFLCMVLVSCDRQKSCELPDYQEPCDLCGQLKRRVLELEAEVERLKHRRQRLREEKSDPSQKIINSAKTPVEKKYRTAMEYLGSGNREGAYPVFRELAENGHTGAILQVANHCLSGQNVCEEDIQELYGWLVGVADSGDYEAAVRLAGLYAKGLLEDDDLHSQERKWQERVESLVSGSNDSYALYRLAGYFKAGWFLRKDSGKELFYLEKAADGGHSGACVRLAKIYYAEQRFDDARRLLDKAFADDAQHTLESFVRGEPLPIKNQKEKWYLSGENEPELIEDDSEQKPLSSRKIVSPSDFKEAQKESALRRAEEGSWKAAFWLCRYYSRKDTQKMQLWIEKTRQIVEQLPAEDPSKARGERILDQFEEDVKKSVSE